MARRKFVDVERIDPEVTQKPEIDMNVLEIRGRDKKWRILYPDPQNMITPVPIIKDGIVIGTVPTFVATNKMHEVHEVFTSLEAAKEVAEWIHPGCEIKVVKTSNRDEALVKARETRRKQQEETNDE